MNLTESDLRHIARKRALSPFLIYLNIGSVIAFLLVLFLVATELFALLYILAGLWTTFIIVVWHKVRQNSRKILKELKSE